MKEVYHLTRQGFAWARATVVAGEQLIWPTESHAMIEGVGSLEFDLTEGIERIRQASSDLTGLEIDGALVGIVPECLPFGLRMAANRSLWAWLTTAKLPELAARRYPDSKGRPLAKRYVGSLTDNVLARLWWANARCCDPDYAAKLVSTQYLLERVLDWAPCRSPHVARALIDVFGGVGDAPLIYGVLKRVRVDAVTVSLDAMTQDEVAQLIRGVRDELRPDA